MKTRLIIAIALYFAGVVVLSLLFFGCAKGEKSEPPKSGEPKIVSPEPQKEKTGTVVGKIVYKGTPPAIHKVKVNKDNEICGEYQFSEELVVNPENKGVKWAVINVKNYIKGDFVSQEKILDQKECRFQPHVLAIEAGDKVNILNSDGVLHNIHSFPTGGNPAFNEAQPKFKKQITKVFNVGGDIIKIKCDAHSWMNGWIKVVQNPYYDMTNGDGEFRIENVPIGRQILEVWHETLGTAVMEVVVREGGESRAETLEWSLVSAQPVPDKSPKQKGTTIAKPIFDASCSACHGLTGKGDGPAAVSLPNKPANLTLDATQKKSDSDLEKTIRDGRQDKGMPPWPALSASDIKNLVSYIRYLGGK